MWRYVLSGAGVVGLTLLLLAGSLASWSFGGGRSPAHQGAPLAATPATSVLAKPALTTGLPGQPIPSTAASEEDAVRLALAALAYVPPASLPNVSPSAALPPAVSPSPESLSSTTAPAVAPPAPMTSTPSTAATTPSRSTSNFQSEEERTGASTEDLNQQSLDAARAGRVFVSRTVLRGADGRVR